MKKYLFILLSLVFVCCCCTAFASTLNASWADGRLTVWVDWTESPAAVMLSGDGVGGSRQLNTNTNSLTVDFPADNQYHTVRCNAFPGLTGFSGSATFYAGVLEEHHYIAVVTEPTCTEKGYTTYTCECGDSYVADEVPALGHDLVVDAGVAATCTTAGKEAGEHCSRCDYVKEGKVIPALGHDIVVDEGVAASCTEAGKTAGEHCTRCDYVKEGEVIPALGHKPVKIEGKEPTATENGLTEGEKCSVCGEILKPQEIIPALGHTAETIKGKAPTCTETGLTDGIICSECGEILQPQEVIPALGHTPEKLEGKDPTCTEDGLTEGEKCSVCGEILKAQEVIPAKGHNVIIIPGKAATCTATGLTEGKKCSVCFNWIEEQEVLPKLEHDWKMIDKGYAATETENGKEPTYECSMCGETKGGEIIPKLGCEHAHVEVVAEVAATCTNAGYTAGEYCSDCGKWLSGHEVIPATGHTPKSVPGVAATCTAGGYTEGSVCAVCGAELVARQRIPALGHYKKIYSQDEKETIYYCVRCNRKFTEANQNAATDDALNYGEIVFDSNKTPVDYTAEKIDETLSIVADLSAEGLSDEIGLFLSKDLVETLSNDGIEVVNFVVDDSTIEIQLADLSDDWFDTEESISTYVIWMNPKYSNPNGQKGTMVRIEAYTEDESVVIGDQFSGLKLITIDAEADVNMNGLYVKE